MAIPPVKLFSNEPGGGLNVAMKANNALANDMILRQMNQIKKQYLPTTMQAEAASKLAYANLMGPQFMAKLLQNPGAIANMGDDAAKAALQSAVGAGMGQGTGNAFNQMQSGGQGGHSGIGQPSTNSLSGWFADKLKGAFGSSPKQNALAMGGSASNPGQYNAPAEYNSAPEVNEPGDNINHGVDAAWDRWLRSPEGQKEMNREGGAIMPSDEQILAWDKTRKPINIDMQGGKRNGKSYAENTGTYEGVVAEGKELGKIRANSKKELDQDYQQALQLKQPFQKLNSIITNPTFQKLRQLPGFQSMQMNAKSKIGSKEEQDLIGQFQAAARNVVAATVKGFGGRILASEIPLSESMKLSDNDTIGVMLGKAPVIEEFNEMTLQRSRIASKLMKDYHLDKGEALEQADKLVDGEAIRKQVEQELKPKEEPITDDDIQATMDATGMTREEIIRRLKEEGRHNG